MFSRIRYFFRHAPVGAWHAVPVLLVVQILLAFFAGSCREKMPGMLPLSKNIFAKPAFYVGMTDQPALFTDGFTKITLTLRERKVPMPESVSGRVLLTIGEKCDILPGALISFKAKVARPRVYKNPGVFDYRKYLEQKNIWGKAFVEKCSDVAVMNQPQTPFFLKIRERVLQPMPERHREILSALLLGTRTIEKDDEDMIRNAGLSHLFAISGANFSVMSVLVFFLVSAFTRFFPKIYLYVARQKLAAAATLLFVAGYLMILEPNPSVLRAAIMVGLFLLAILVERQKHLVHITLISASVILLIRPFDIFDAGFQLSYLCIFILLIILPHFTIRGSHPVHYVLTFMVANLVLNILLIPLMLFIFGEVSLLGLVHNLWAIPYFFLVVTPLSLAHLLCSLLGLFSFTWIYQAFDLSIHIFLKILVGASHFLPDLTLKSFTPHFIHVFIFYFFIFVGFVFHKRIFFVMMIFLLPVSLLYSFYDLHWRHDVKINQIDVEQGDAILIQTRGKNILIDAGGNFYFDVGARVVAPYLRYHWIAKLDLVIVTHADLDHYGGLTSLLDEIPIKEIWLNGMMEGDVSYRDLIKKINVQKISLKKIMEPETLFLDENTKMQVLAPDADFLAVSNDNDRSIVIKLTHGDFDALFTGDLSKRGEEILVKKYGKELQSEYLKVGHHGSASSSSQLFLSVVNPQTGSIGVAEESRFGHPHREVIERLKDHGIQVFRTDLHGTVQVVLDDGKIEVSTYVH